MTEKKKQLQPKLALDMDFAEALERFAKTKPQEVSESIERAKTKKPPGEGVSRRPARRSKRGK